MKITVLMGGTSAERDVSIASSLRVAEALRTRGHDVVTVDTARGPLTEKAEQLEIQAPRTRFAHNPLCGSAND